MAIIILHCQNRDFRLLCYLDLDPMTSIYELDPYSLEIHRMCKYDYVETFESYRLTDIHTKPKLYTSFAVGRKSFDINLRYSQI